MNKKSDDNELLLEEIEDESHMYDPRRPDYANLKEYFPFVEMRTIQDKLSDALQKKLDDPKIKLIIAELPTGVGKSPLSLMISEASKYAYIMTANKNLQAQYVKDFSDKLVEVKGRANYECYRYTEDQYNCANSPCRNTPSKRRECREAGDCEYHHVIRDAVASPSVLFNFASGALQLRYNHSNFKHRNIMIIDEAHAILNTLTDQFSINMKSATITEVLLDEKLIDAESIDEYYQFIKNIKNQTKSLLDNGVFEDASARKKLEDLHNKTDSFVDLYNKVLATDEGRDLEKYFAISKKYKNLENDEEFESEGLRIVEPGKDNIILQSIEFRPLHLDKAFSLLTSKVDKVIMLSATFLDFDMYRKILGFNPEEVAVMRCGSPFPAKNRPIITSRAVGYLNRKNLEANKPKLLARVDEILSEHENESGIIHGQTYALCNHIYYNSKNRHRLIYPKTAAEQKEALDMHANRPAGTVLLSPSMVEGVDLKGDLSRFQIFLKAPYPYLGDQVLKKRKDLYPGYYELLTALALIQGLGRSNRSEEDYCVSYFMDKCILNFVNKNNHLFPKYILDAFE